MCIICNKTYDENTIELICCLNVTEIPILPELKILWCSVTNITEIPILPKLRELRCSNTNITEIPILPKLRELRCFNTNITEIPILPELKVLDCSDTKITSLPKIPNCSIYADNCVWLNPSAERINKLVILQKWMRSIINKRTKIIHAAMVTHRDLIHVLNA
jgi:Leucine-rich repeat (LRR) protein